MPGTGLPKRFTVAAEDIRHLRDRSHGTRSAGRYDRQTKPVERTWRIADGLEHFCHLGDRVIDQARRRVLFGEQLATDEKIYSIFEPHTDLIKRGKVRTPVEFGHKVFLAESAAGLITQYEVLRGNPPDEVHVAFSLQ